jgi:hypothetical protein
MKLHLLFCHDTAVIAMGRRNHSRPANIPLNYRCRIRQHPLITRAKQSAGTTQIDILFVAYLYVISVMPVRHIGRFENFLSPRDSISHFIRFVSLVCFSR